MDNIAVGMAAELRVMSELVIKGFNPAKSYMDKGVDLILENGKKIQVKASNSLHNYGGTRGNLFQLGRGNKKRRDGSKFVDFYIFWVINSMDFWIVPSKKLSKVSSFAIPKTKTSVYFAYKNNWNLLRR